MTRVVDGYSLGSERESNDAPTSGTSPHPPTGCLVSHGPVTRTPAVTVLRRTDRVPCPCSRSRPRRGPAYRHCVNPWGGTLQDYLHAAPTRPEDTSLSPATRNRVGQWTTTPESLGCGDSDKQVARVPLLSRAETHSA